MVDASTQSHSLAVSFKTYSWNGWTSSWTIGTSRNDSLTTTRVLFFFLGHSVNANSSRARRFDRQQNLDKKIALRFAAMLIRWQFTIGSFLFFDVSNRLKNCERKKKDNNTSLDHYLCLITINMNSDFYLYMCIVAEQ